MEPTAEILRRRASWVNTGRVRPAFAEAPGVGQRSVWDFPRPPRVEPIAEQVRVEFGGRVVADSAVALQVLETAGPPTVYVRPADVVLDALIPSQTETICEWKGRARHFTLRVGNLQAVDAAWVYDDPFPEFRRIRGFFAFHAARVDRCWIGEEAVTPQPGGYYGGWVTKDLAGPFKGGPDSSEW